MSRNVIFACSCGEASFTATSSFTFVVWNDGLDALEALGLDNPYRYYNDWRQADGGELLRWWEDTLAVLRAERDRLPTLYQIWRERQGPHGRVAESDVGYFWWRGTVYMAEGTYDELTAAPITPEVLESRRSRVPYEPPVLEEVALEVAATLTPSGGVAPGEVVLPAAAFERIFRGTPLTLEHGNLLDVYAGELREIEEVARHAAERGESIAISLS